MDCDGVNEAAFALRVLSVEWPFCCNGSIAIGAILEVDRYSI